MPFMGDVCAACGQYDGNDGVKTRFVRIGAWFESEQGQLSAKLDALPLQDSKGEVWLKFFPKKEEGQNSQQNNQNSQQNNQQAPPAQQQQRQQPNNQQQAPAAPPARRGSRY